MTQPDSLPPRASDRAGGESPRKRAFREHGNRDAASRDRQLARRAFFYDSDSRYLRTLVPEGMCVLDLGCGTGALLERLRPARGVGIDLSPGMIAVAQAKRPHLEFHVGDVEDDADMAQVDGPFDYILLSDTLAVVDDCQETLAALHRLCTRDTRIIIAHYSALWEPTLTVAEFFGLKTRQPQSNWLAEADIVALLGLADFEAVRTDRKQLCPVRLLGLGVLVNRYLASLPLLRQLCLRHYVVARSLRHRGLVTPSVSILIPCRNERENVAAAVRRTPQLADEQEILFIEGHSQDGTWAEIQRVCRDYPNRNMRALRQPGAGKADAVWAGFAAATGDILMILDGDLTVPPEALQTFYRAVCDGQGEFVMGTRMVYPTEVDAMRFLNYRANRIFASLFSWLLRQRITDTLCGTKVMTRTAYERLLKDQFYGRQDPFADFQLILGAARQSLKITEIPVRYAARSYGETQISRFRHGLLLARMVVRTYRRMRDT